MSTKPPIQSKVLVGFVGVFGLAVAVFSAVVGPSCSSTIGTVSGDEDLAGETADGGGGGPRDLSFNPDAFWADDPPPKYCALDGGVLPPPKPPGGTPECPDDKNRQGCACTKVGETAACWPGLRANRGLGICSDGTTTCTQNGEFGAVWGPCQGYTLPVPGATTGAEACKCFSRGRWALDNLVPCFYSINMKLVGAASSVKTGDKIECQPMPSEPLTKPTLPWSANKLTVDCVGRWKLCYTLKAGDGKNPMPGDCTVATVCTQGDYTTASMEQSLPVLPAWVTTTAAQVACAEQFTKTGGYGEMSVDGQTVTCESVQKVFNRVVYCPLSCNTNPMAPECKNCMSGGSGTFLR